MPDYDNIKCSRNKKSDKEKKNNERNGKFSSKHIRFTEALMEKNATKPKTK